MNSLFPADAILSGAKPAAAPAARELRRVEFFHPCNPPRASHHQKIVVPIKTKSGQVWHKPVDSSKLTAAKGFWETIFLTYQPSQMLQGPLRLYVELVWPWNQGDSKKLRANGRIWHPANPDLDNMSKTITDCLANCAYMQNDSQIVNLVLQKYRGDEPGIRVVMEELA